jgi:hypothetical protein
MKYFISIKGKKQGPYNLDELKKLNLFNTTLVWKDGMQDWQQAKEIDELKEITLTPPPELPKGKLSGDEIVKIFFIHLLFGVGFFYVDKTIQRKFLYPAFGLYALLDLILGPGLDIEPFKGDFGGVTFVISLVLCYLIGYVDVYYHRYKMSQEENTVHNNK